MIFRLASPWMLILLIPAVLAAWWMSRRRARADARVDLPGAEGLLAVGKSAWVILDRAMPWVRLAALVLVVVALARPQAGSTTETVTSYGVDIVIAMDISYSMLAEDFQPRNRLEVARQTVAEFVQGRPSDRIGLVVFGLLASTRGPLTLDHEMLLDLLKEVRVAPPDRSATALGMGLATAVNRLRRSEARSRVAVLITDGRNNAGQVAPEAAADAAAALGIRVYTIGVGTEGEAPLPLDTPAGRVVRSLRLDLDEPLLRKIADGTGGRYFRVTEADGMRETFRVIDELEKTEIESTLRVHYAEIFPGFLNLAALILLLDWILAGTRLRRIP